MARNTFSPSLSRHTTSSPWSSSAASNDPSGENARYHGASFIAGSGIGRPVSVSTARSQPPAPLQPETASDLPSALRARAWKWSAIWGEGLSRDAFVHLGKIYEPLVSGGALLAVYWLILYWMYGRKIFLTA